MAAFNQDGGRLGGASQDNLMMDGISAMDTGNNGQMINMNIESIGEIKVLTQGYQAEYGRSSGLQITAVTKSGTNQFHGSGYSVFTDSDWNKNSWAAQKNGDAKSKSSQQTYGYTIGGPVRIPKVFDGRNKLFFFYAHEFRAADLDDQRHLLSGIVCRRHSSAPATSPRAATTTAHCSPR